jgi:hypothetical protein
MRGLESRDQPTRAGLGGESPVREQAIKGRRMPTAVNQARALGTMDSMIPSGGFNGDGVWGRQFSRVRRLGGRCEMHSHEILAHQPWRVTCQSPPAAGSGDALATEGNSAPQVSSHTTALFEFAKGGARASRRRFQESSPPAQSRQICWHTVAHGKYESFITTPSPAVTFRIVKYPSADGSSLRFRSHCGPRLLPKSLLLVALPLDEHPEGPPWRCFGGGIALGRGSMLREVQRFDS